MINHRLLLGLLILFVVGVALQMGGAAAISAEGQPLDLPIGVETFKIVVEEDGIYEIDQAALAAAGMDVANVDPATLKMMHRGETLSYDFIGDGDADFEVGEKIRFYGGRFDESRREDLFYLKDVFWLWADAGDGSRVTTVNNELGGTVATDWPSSITFDPMLYFYAGYTDRWDSFDNEPDAWYWLLLFNARTYTIPVELPNPTATTTGEMTVEVTSFAAPNVFGHDLEVQLEDAPPVSRRWDGIRNVNIVSQIPAGTLINGTNTISITGDTRDVNGDLRSDEFHLNRITVDYRREFVAIDNELTFKYDNGGTTEFAISNFSSSNPVVWDITDKMNPVEVAIDGGDVVGGVLTFGRNLPTQSEFIATANLLTPTEISSYTPQNIEPANGAEWVAIAHNTLLTQTERLATHRAATSFLTTHVIDVEDVYNQYGYGYPVPEGIKDFTQNAYDNWTTPIHYLVLVGDATHNPNKLACSECNSWNTVEETYVVTDLVYEDRFLGLIPSDHTFTMLEGDDVLPDITVGRMSSRNDEEARVFVDKIIEYEQSVIAQDSWTRRMVFLADNRDAGGNFCFENQSVGSTLPNEFTQTAFCLDDYGGDSNANKSQLRADFFNELAGNSAGIVNYRGHGSITDWGAGIVRRQDAALFLNADRPTVIISADCLDGNFVWLGSDAQAPDYRSALSETFLRLDGRGTAAHWGSSGLGFSSEHTVLHLAFYEALYEGEARTMGDAVQYSKIQYLNSNQHESEAYAFILHGDPAMRMPSTQVADVETTPETADQSAAPTVDVSYDVTVANRGTGNDSFDITLSGNQWAASADTTLVTLAADTETTVRVTHTVPADALAGAMDEVTVTARSRFNGAVSDSSVLETTVTAVYAVETAAPVTAKSARSNSTVTYDVTIENKSNTAATFDITVSGNQWTVNAPTSVSLAVGETQTIQVEHLIPSLQEAAQDSVTVTATSAVDGSATDSVTLTTSAEVLRLFLPVVSHQQDVVFGMRR